jgi:hypothetical protein
MSRAVSSRAAVAAGDDVQPVERLLSGDLPPDGSP